MSDPRDWRSPRTWRHHVLAAFLVGVFVGAFVGALIYDLVVTR